MAADVDGAARSRAACCPATSQLRGSPGSGASGTERSTPRPFSFSAGSGEASASSATVECVPVPLDIEQSDTLMAVTGGLGYH